MKRVLEVVVVTLMCGLLAGCIKDLETVSATPEGATITFNSSVVSPQQAEEVARANCHQYAKSAQLDNTNETRRGSVLMVSATYRCVDQQR